MTKGKSIQGSITTQQRHLPLFDGLRGFTGLWVVLGHTVHLTGGSFPLIGSPGAAVDIFMIISGFLMAHNYRRREDREPWERASTWSSFYLRRFFRIAPLYYIVLLFVFLTHDFYTSSQLAVLQHLPFHSNKEMLTHFSAHEITGADVLSRFAFFFGAFPDLSVRTILPDWSISLEMQFYLLFPFLMLALQRLGYLALGGLSLVGFAVAHWLFGTYSGTAPHLLGIFPQPSFLPLKIQLFIAGIFFAESVHFQKSRKGLSTLLGGGAILLAGFDWFTNRWAIVLLAVGTVLLALLRGDICARLLAPIRALLSSRFSSFLADASYSVYLLHLLIIVPVVAWLCQFPQFLNAHWLLRFWIVFPIAAALIYPLAYICHRFIEQPGIALGRRINSRRTSSVNMPATTEGAF